MTPEEYEHHVADVLRSEGWSAQVTPAQRDFGLDVVAERGSVRLGVQVKMYGDSTRRIGSEVALHLFGAAAYAGCDERLIATNGGVHPDAVRVAEKLSIDIRHISATGPAGLHHTCSPDPSGWSFAEIWTHMAALEGSALTRPNGKVNHILAVDGGGIQRRTSGGTVQRIQVETFRWAVERLIAGDIVTRREIDERDPRRVSSGVMLILLAMPMFEAAKTGRSAAVRLRARQAIAERPL